MSNTFNVVLTGELLKGQSIMQAANSLSRLFKIAPLQAQHMLARAPLVIKKNLEEDTAVRFVQAMYKSGFGASVEPQKAVKTSLLLHSLAPLYEDDDEGATVTKITPVLVEQSRLDESLDNELSIPGDRPLQLSTVNDNPSAQLISNLVNESPRVTSEPDVEQFKATVQPDSLNLPIHTAQEETLIPQESLPIESLPEVSLRELTPQENASEDETLQEEILQKEILPVEALSAESELLRASSDAIAQLNLDEAVLVPARNEGVVAESDAEVNVIESPIEAAGECVSEAAAESHDSSYDINDKSATNAELAEIPRVDTLPQKLDSRAFDPFAAWSDEDHKTPSADMAGTDQSIAEPEIHKLAAQLVADNEVDVVVETSLLVEAVKNADTAIQPQENFDQAEDEEIELANTSAIVEESLVLASASQEIKGTSIPEEVSKMPLEAISKAEILEVELVTEVEPVAELIEVPKFELADQPVAVDEQALADEVLQDIKTIELVPIEELVDNVETAASDTLDVTTGEEIKDIEALQWVEPVAQWQTVAELAEAVALDRAAPADHALVDAEALLSESVSTQATYAEEGRGGNSLFHNAGGVEEKNGVAYGNSAESLFPEEDSGHAAQDHWDAPVQVSPALTERLAQIAKQSRETITKDDALQQLEIVDDSNTTAFAHKAPDCPDDVLLFEEADVSQISALDGQDWLLVDSGGETKNSPVFNPLLDFDQVEPDWKDRRVDLSFATTVSAPVSSSSFDLELENQQELQAFLASSDYDDRPTYADPQPLVAASSELTDTASQDQNPRAEGAFSTEILAADLVQIEATVEPTRQVESQVDSCWTHKISVQAECGFLEVSIPQGRELNVAAAASVTMGLSLHEQLQAGNGVKAWLLAKGFLINTYEAVESTGNLGITAITHGMVCGIDVSEFPVMVQQSAYLASTDEVKLNADQSRLNPVVNACKWMHCSGAGELWLNAQGLWEMIEVDGSFTINSRYIMAFSQSLKLQAPPLAGLKSYLTSGGGVECRLKGRGLVWVQTEAAKAPVLWQKTG